jgi:hypothetical protein
MNHEIIPKSKDRLWRTNGMPWRKKEICQICKICKICKICTWASVAERKS